MKYGVVYAIVCIENDKYYIGSTLKYEDRIKSHFKKLKNNEHNKLIQHDYNIYGKDSFSYYILEKDIPEKLLEEKEQYWINKMFSNDSNIGYNVLGANRHGAEFKSHTEETKKRISSNTNVKGNKNPMYGKKQSEESKQAVSKANSKLPKEKYPDVLFMFHNMTEPKMERYKIIAEVYNVSWRTIQRAIIGS